MKVALAQLNPTVGDVAGNTSLVLDAMDQARGDGANILVTSELVLIGYPPRDLLQRESMVESCEQAVERIAKEAGDLWVVVGHPRRSPNGTRPFHNSASVCHNGKVVGTTDKQLLPGYDVFDEDRYFEPGQSTGIFEIAGQRTGVLICEDLWRAEDVAAHRSYTCEPIKALAEARVELAFVLNASPFVLGKWQRHLEQLSQIASQNRLQLIAVNQVGGNDDLIFDGRSVVVGKDGTIHHVLPGWRSAVETVEVEKCDANSAEMNIKGWSAWPREVFHALALGVRDYVHKTNHREVIIGLSGGVDSALTATIAAVALGPEHVRGVLMPSRFSSEGAMSDALDVASRLRLAHTHTVSIRELHQAMRTAIEPVVKERIEGVTDENMQARIRGVILMAMSNAYNAFVLSTSNKSEIATGYSTLYGDMCGAFAALGDLTKTRIYELARWVNANHREFGFSQPPIPENSINKEPSAELRPNQTDQDTLPAYDVLDKIVEAFIEDEKSVETIVRETGIEESVVKRAVRMIDIAQYKRDQAPVIPKITWRAFGRGRMMPIVMKQSASSSQRSAVHDSMHGNG